MHRPRHLALVFLCLLPLLSACGTAQADELATRARITAPTAVLPTAVPTPRDAIETEADAIRVAKLVVSPYLQTWQDVVATRESGVWRVIFRGYYALPKGATPDETYYRVPLSVFIDAATGIVLRQGYV